MGAWPFAASLGAWVESPRVQNGIIALIVFNAITLGLETSSTVRAHAGELLIYVEALVLAIFIAEILIKLYAHGLGFFRHAWNVFDFSIVAVSLVPASGPFAVFRTLRILRTLRLLTKIPRLRHIIESLLAAIPSIGWIVFLLGMVFYIFAVMGTKLFGEAFPEDFGHLGLSLYSLFQIMTLESWSESLARPVMATYPLAWIYFIAFILITAFTILNLFIGIIVNVMQERQTAVQEGRRDDRESQARTEREAILERLAEIDARLARIEERSGS
jgi:voltage-gated sodium channel